MEGRDCLRFAGAIAALAITHALLFDLDDFDMTQFWVAAAAYTIVSAIRETKAAPARQRGEAE